MPAGRPRKLSKSKFLKAFAEGNNALDLSDRLGVTVQTVYNYFKRLDLEVPKNTRDKQFRKKIVTAFEGKTTVEEVAREVCRTPSSVRYHLRLYIKRHWRKPRDTPKPERPNELKIVRLITRRPELFDNPPKVAQLTNLSMAIVTAYLGRTYEHRVRQAKAQSRRAA